MKSQNYGHVGEASSQQPEDTELMGADEVEDYGSDTGSTSMSGGTSYGDMKLDNGSGVPFKDLKLPKSK